MQDIMGRKGLLIVGGPKTIDPISFALMRGQWTAPTREFMRKLCKALPDLVILNVILTGQSGFDAPSSLRAVPEHRDISVLTLTARGFKNPTLHGL